MYTYISTHETGKLFSTRHYYLDDDHHDEKREGIIVMGIGRVSLFREFNLRKIRDKKVDEIVSFSTNRAHFRPRRLPKNQTRCIF